MVPQSAAAFLIEMSAMKYCCWPQLGPCDCRPADCRLTTLCELAADVDVHVPEHEGADRLPGGALRLLRVRALRQPDDACMRGKDPGKHPLQRLV